MQNKSKQVTRYGAYGVVVLESKLLLTLKKSGPYKGLWDLPGGKIEFGESPEEALKRELVEEAALAANSFDLLTIAVNRGEYLRDEAPYQFHPMGIIYRVNEVSTVPDLIPEEELRWAAPSEIHIDELTPFAKQIIKEWK